MKFPPENRCLQARINQSQSIHIRPAESQYPEETRITLDASLDGLYFATSLGHYFVGMAVYVTRNFLLNDPSNREEEAKVVRVDVLKSGRWGVAIQRTSSVKLL